MRNPEADARAFLPTTNPENCKNYPDCDLRPIPLWARLDDTDSSNYHPGLFYFSALTKHHWAHSRIHDLRDIVDLSTDKHTGTVTPAKRDAEGNTTHYRVEISGYPFGIAVYVSDVINALRSSLDYVAQGITKGGGKPSETAFPILKHGRAANRGDARKWTAQTFGMNKDALQFVERFQPYGAPKDTKVGDANLTDDAECALWLIHLSESANQDKHRRLIEFKVRAWVEAIVRDDDGQLVRFRTRTGESFKNDSEFISNSLIGFDDPSREFRPADFDAKPQFRTYADPVIEKWPDIDQGFQIPRKHALIAQLHNVAWAVGHVLNEATKVWPTLRRDVPAAHD